MDAKPKNTVDSDRVNSTNRVGETARGDAGAEAVEEISPGGGVASEMAARPGVAQPDLKRGIIKNEDTASERLPGGTSDQQSPGAANEAGAPKHRTPETAQESNSKP